MNSFYQSSIEFNFSLSSKDSKLDFDISFIPKSDNFNPLLNVNPTKGRLTPENVVFPTTGCFVGILERFQKDRHIKRH